MEQSSSASSEITPEKLIEAGNKEETRTSEELDALVSDFNSSIGSTSRSGRKRKQINYFDLANPEDYDDEFYIPAVKKKELSPVKATTATTTVTTTAAAATTATTTTTKRRRGRPRKIRPSEELRSVEEKVQEAQNLIKTEANESNLNLSVNQKSSGENVFEEKQDNLNGSKDGSESSVMKDVEEAVNISPKTPVKSRAPSDSEASNEDSMKKKYVYSGDTVKMMNTLFNYYKKEGDDESTSKGPVPSTLAPKGRGRPKKVFIQKEKESEEEFSVTCTCGVCNEVMTKTLWTHHKYRYHNNLAWRKGETPLDLEDQHVVMPILNGLYKKKKPLFCGKCGKALKSVVGFLSHQSQCQKTDEELQDMRIACDICGRKVLPVSMVTHIKLSHDENKEYKPKKEKKTDGGSSSKRKAHKKALKIIEEVSFTDEDHPHIAQCDFIRQNLAKDILRQQLESEGTISCKYEYCDFTADKLDEISSHLETCSLKPSKGYSCKVCLLTRNTLKEISAHLNDTHDIQLEDNDEYETDSEKKDFSNFHRNYKLPPFLIRSVPKSKKVLFPQSFEWTFKFNEEQYNNETLFPELSCNPKGPILPVELALQYLPRPGISCDVARTTVTELENCQGRNFEFKHFDLFDFEQHKEDGKCTIFCGGPITALAWLPISCKKMSEKQIIAVTTLLQPDDQHLLHENYADKVLIQIWSLGILKNKEAPEYEPTLELGLAFDHGPIWDLQWCPSGCYDSVTMKRMGLLAVAGSDTVIYIYSIPFVEKKKLIFKPKPVLKLYLFDPNENAKNPGGIKYHPTKLSWTKASGHAHIAVGYTNGFVALFNLGTKSDLLRTQDTNGITCLFPKKSFQAHLHSITGLVLYHLNGGCKWLLTSSLDRKTCIFNLQTDCNYPIWQISKSIVSDVAWLTNWLGVITSTEDVNSCQNNTTTIRQVYDYVHDARPATIFGSMSSITSITFSDWLNTVIQANGVGEIQGCMCHQLLYPEQTKFLRKKRMLFGYAQLIDKAKSPDERLDEAKKKKTQTKASTSNDLSTARFTDSLLKPPVISPEPLFFDEAQKKYGLVFCDNTMVSLNNFTDAASEQLKPLSKNFAYPQENIYPLTKINKIALNPNRQASLYYASAYQAGFLRITWLQFLKSDSQIK